MDLNEITTLLTDRIVFIGEQVDDMPGLHAFGLGLFTWFAVEQILRRIVSWMRWVILIGAVAGLGLSMPWLSDTLGSLQPGASQQRTAPSEPQG